MCTFLAVLASAIALSLLQQTPALSRPSLDPQLESAFRDWEKKASGIHDLYCTFKTTRNDRIFRRTSVQSGEAWISRANLLKVKFNDDQGRLAHILVSTGKEFHLYDFEKQVELIYRVGPRDENPEKLGFWDRLDWLLSGGYADWARIIALGPSLSELQTRFKSSLDKQDAEYLYLRLEPRTEQDRANFRLLYLVLEKSRGLVKTAVFDQPSGNRVQYSLDRITTNLKPAISLESLTKDLPKGWNQLTSPGFDAKERGEPRKQPE